MTELADPFAAFELDDDELAYRAELEREFAFAFHRSETRRTRLKRRCDCGHWIDGTEPYRYSVWRVNSDPAGVIQQRLDCEFCARADNRY